MSIMFIDTKYASQSRFKKFSVIDSRGDQSKSPQEHFFQ